jgi:hypothetical protein
MRSSLWLGSIHAHSPDELAEEEEDNQEEKNKEKDKKEKKI